MAGHHTVSAFATVMGINVAYIGLVDDCSSCRDCGHERTFHAYFTTCVVSITKLDSGTRISDRSKICQWLGCHPSEDHGGVDAGGHRLGAVRRALTAKIIMSCPFLIWVPALVLMC